MFTTAEDIANRAIQHVGAKRITSLSDLSKQALEINFCYDKLRQAELRRSVWRFATRRATLRAFTTTTFYLLPATYSASTTYVQGDLVTDSNGVVWVSMFGSNVGHTPGTYVSGRLQWWQQFFGSLYVATWDSTLTYNAGEIVSKSGPVFYMALTNNNLNLDPATHATNWATITGGTEISPFFPAGVGPAMTVTIGSTSFNRNLFPLPYGFMRLAAPDPKAAQSSVLATSGAIGSLDWQLEDQYIVSNQAGPLLVRFVADLSDVTKMDPLFCEGLAARIGYEVCEVLTQSNIKLQAIGQSYQTFMKDARTVNAIEIGSTEVEEDQFELTRGPQGVIDAVPLPESQGGR